MSEIGEKEFLFGRNYFILAEIGKNYSLHDNI